MRSNPTDILQIINNIRTDPRENSRKLFAQLQHSFTGDDLYAYGKIIQTFEGPIAVHDLLEYLEKVPASTSLIQSKAMNEAAMRIAKEKGLYGSMENENPKLIYRKIREGGQNVNGKIGQLIALGTNSPQEVVTYLMMDDGLVSRKRRRMLLDNNYRYCGIGRASHSRYGNITVILLAEKIQLLEQIELNQTQGLKQTTVHRYRYD